ncbi:hypothetical protein PV05_02630 [Exophiala xenobiotica]|uniref:Uncharacterized protein n=1 Tax=Exophiala xenobiotica TaxID=348802 RepID=A0A0D2ETL8_9EURO|nr:uncharacterized protein PV05_02630 [Exophiala xenobiotica]KIW58080.1 hypothetical protein PV05_02630 [Exophiala xenobiotica]
MRQPGKASYQDTVTPTRPRLFVAPLPIGDHGRRKIVRVLVANRGEIACRIIATCRKLDLTSIAIYAEEDSTSLHVGEADEAINLGSISQEAGNPFLNVQRLVEVAQSSNADAVHPGYGYLSENEQFADAVRQAGMIFIGPGSEAMATLGDKRNSKDYLRKHAPEVPLIPGFTGSEQNIDDLQAAAEKVGYPVMLKASAGGGGRGMRIVREKSHLATELARAQSEAKRSFGSSDCILEKYIEAAKHVEVQIIGDGHGNVLSLWERECSVQRRHQKIIEETPSPFLTPEQRRRMCAVAVRIGKLIGYEGAGTVEFVVDAKTGHFYFLEVNTRLQVEHPITEEVTGMDIVAMQLFVAAGGRFSDIPYLQRIPQHGHAIECRLCAENPANDFLPEHGTIRLWREAHHQAGSRDVRFETAVTTGSKVSIYFDSMIAKIVVWAPTRAMAVTKMIKVMSNTVCAGVRTNQLFLQACLAHDSFQDPAYTTSLIPNNLTALLKNPHSTTAPRMVSMLSLVPGLVLHQLSGTASASKPFAHVRQAFRNQCFDSVNVDSLIIVPNDSSSHQPPMLSIWSLVNARDKTKYKVTLIPVSELEEQCQERGSTALEMSRRYHSISHKLRDQTLVDAPSYTVSLTNWKPLVSTEGSLSSISPSWRTAMVGVTINQSTIHAYMATDADINAANSAGSCQSVLCHFPALGTWLEYKCYSLLNYMESLRAELVASGTGAASGVSAKSIKSPMPCKILSVLKKNGEEVKNGETVMVIESMKMETNIIVNADGKFMTSVKQGDGVDDGVVLCWVE